MARSTTYYGLTEQAKKYISAHAVFEPHEYTDGWGNIINTTRPVMQKHGTCGMFGEYDLNKYKMKDGTWAYEYVQASPWASGPHEFIALQHGDEKIGLWDDKTINKV